MRDKLISLSERRPSCIPLDENDFPTLSLDAFDISGMSRALQKYSIADDDLQATILAKVCMHKAKLCIILGRILNTQYQLRASRPTESAESTVSLVPSFSASASAACMARDQEMREWGMTICSDLQPLVKKDARRNSQPVAVHCAVIELLYQSLAGMVHRPQILQSQPPDSAAQALQAFSQRTIRTAAQRISEIVEFLQDEDLLRFLPPIGLTALLSAALQHVKDAVSSSPSIRGLAQRYLKKTMDIMIQLEETYPQANHAVAFLELVRDKKLYPPDESHDLGPKKNFSFFRGEASNSATLNVELSNRILERRPTDIDIDDGALDYSRRTELESHLNLDGISEAFLSGNLDFTDFEGINWTELLQERNWDI